MPDRLMVIMQLGALATDAAQRGDDRAAVTLQQAAELLFQDKEVADRVERRKRGDRERKPVKNPRIPRNPAESAESESAPSVFPHTPFPTPPASTTTTLRACEAISDSDAQLTEGLMTLVAQSMGALWPDVDAFVRQRNYETWKGWLKEMQTLLVGGQATPADVAQACRDAQTLDRPLSTPKGFRAFVGSAVRERLSSQQTGAPKLAGGGRATLMLAEIRKLIRTMQQPGQAAIRYIPKADVQKLGADVFRAYEGIGGAERVIGATGETMSYLLRDFTQALEAARDAA